MTGTAAAIMKAIAAELNARRLQLDTSSDIGEVSITVKLTAGTTSIRTLAYREERIFRSQPMRRQTDGLTGG